MKAQPQRPRPQTAILIKRAQRAMHESRKLLEEREVQLKQSEYLLQSAAHKEIRGRKGAAAKIGSTRVQHHARVL
jgi:hypothetical protein